jgi:DNA helicase-2/ATP-dependent DNA helicase PcrA
MAYTPTPEQAAIIAHDVRGHACVLAGPGTGKSATVINLLLRADDEQGLRGRLLTFTRAATNELKEKVAAHGERLLPPSTVHSFSIATLLANPGLSGLPEPIRIADDWEWKELIRVQLRDLIGCSLPLVDAARKEMASNWESLEPLEDPNIPDDVRNRFAGAWEQHRVVFGYSLLAELPYRLLRALQDHSELDVGAYDYLVVDEYQDLNQCDLSMLKEITGRGVALIAAGDDDQSIYSFRRAHPIGIRRFTTEDYEGAHAYSMSISQRCGRRILECARHVIEGLPGRPSRPPLTPADHCADGQAHYLQFRSDGAEVLGVVSLVDWLLNSEEVAPEDIAIMYRTDHNKAWSGPLSEALASRGVPVVDTGAVPAMLSTTENRRLLALARLVVNREDSLAWWTLLHLTPQVGNAVRTHFYDGARDSGQTFARQLLAEHAEGFPGLGAATGARVRATIEPALTVISEIDLDGADLGDAGWGTWLAAQADALGGCSDDLRDLLTELDAVIDREEGFGRFLSQLEPVGKDLRSGRTAHSVRLMTMAASKGLTVRAAIVVGVEEGVVPLANRDVDEERRLLYVAMTRATDYLFLTWARQRTGPTARTGTPHVARGRNRSRFLTHGPLQSEDGHAFVDSLP